MQILGVVRHYKLLVCQPKNTADVNCFLININYMVKTVTKDSNETIKTTLREGECTC